MKFKSLRRGSFFSKLNSANLMSPISWIAPVEALESRVMLSVSAGTLAGPVNIVGTEWDYLAQDVEGDAPVTFKEKVVTNSASFSGITCTEIDEGTNFQEQDFFGFDGVGNYINYGYQQTTGGETTTDTYTPFLVNLPAQMTQGVPQSQTVTDNSINTESDGTVDSSSADQDSGSSTLQSETPGTFSFNGKTYDSYTIVVSGTDTPISNSDGTVDPPTTDTITETYAVGIGLVSLNDADVGSETLTAFTTTASHLAVSNVTNTAVDDKIPAVQVSIQNSADVTDTASADAVTITPSISSASTGTGMLSGATPVTTVNGVATFSNLSVDKPGQYVLTFTDNTARTVSTNSFQISAGKLKFEGRVSNAVAGSSIEPEVKVELVDSKGKKITDTSSLVTLSVGDPTVPITGNTAQLVGGVAIFPALKIAKPGNYTLSATDDEGDGTGMSNSIEITGLHFAIREQPGKAEMGVGAPLKYEIELENSRGGLVNNSTLGLRLTLINLDGSTGVLSNAADVFFAGKAANSVPPPISINQPGSYQITFAPIGEAGGVSASDIEPITSDSFKVVANHLMFTAEPRNTHVNTPLVYTLEMKDYRNHLVDSIDQLSFTLKPANSTSTGTLAANTDQLVGGTANNTSNVPLLLNAPGIYTLTVVDIPSTPGDPVAQSATSRNFTVLAQK